MFSPLYVLQRRLQFTMFAQLSGVVTLSGQRYVSTALRCAVSCILLWHFWELSSPYRQPLPHLASNYGGAELEVRSQALLASAGYCGVNEACDPAHMLVQVRSAKLVRGITDLCVMLSSMMQQPTPSNILLNGVACCAC